MKTSLVLSILFCAMSLSCGKLNPFNQSKDTDKELIAIPDITTYQHVSDSTDINKRAAESVVLVANLNGSSGTGFFIHRDGILMTNEHVLGKNNCLRGGCFINLTVNYQKGKSMAVTSRLFAEPLRVNAYFDYSIWRVYELNKSGEKESPFQAESALNIKDQTTSELIGQDVALIGHPAATLKRVKQTRVIDSAEKYAITDKPVLGGTSGSPYVNQQGLVIGINHSASGADEGSVSSLGILGYTNFSATRDILETSGLTDSTDFSKLTKNDSINILPEFVEFKVDSEFDPDNSWHFKVANKIASKADENLNKIFASKVNAYYEKSCQTALDTPATRGSRRSDYNNCSAVLTWINCIEGQKTATTFCPDEASIKNWNEKTYKFALSLNDIDSHDATDPLYFPMAFGKSINERSKLFRDQMHRYLIERKPKLNFDLAYSLVNAAESDLELNYQGTSLKDYFLNFETKPTYQYNFMLIARSLVMLRSMEVIDSDQLKAQMLRLFNDPKCSVRSRLRIEELLYTNGLLSN